MAELLKPQVEISEYFSGLERCCAAERTQKITGIAYDLLGKASRFVACTASNDGIHGTATLIDPLLEMWKNLGMFHIKLTSHGRGQPEFPAAELNNFASAVVGLGIAMKYHQPPDNGSHSGGQAPESPLYASGVSLQSVGTGIYHVIWNNSLSVAAAVPVAVSRKDSWLFHRRIINQLIDAAVCDSLISNCSSSTEISEGRDCA